MKSIITVILVLLTASALSADYGVAKFTNPICGAADPCIVKNPDGPGYWYVYSTNRDICVEYALSPGEFNFRGDNKVFSVTPGTDCAGALWAPELHRLGGKWYIYFTAADDKSIHRLFVVSGDDPMKPFGDLKCMGDHNGKNAIDQTVFEHKGRLYTCYSVIRDNAQWIMIAEMKSPWEFKTQPVYLTHPLYDWETVGQPTNEGPVVLKRNGKIYLIFSAAAGYDDAYSLGVLTYKGGNILNPDNWKKHPEPILTGRGNIRGTGHCTFTKDAEGNDWCVFHCNRPHTEENMGRWVPRFLCLQPVVWINDFPTFSPVVEKPKYFKYER
ncbi:MAG: family 43 glycosylhydrolase [Abditibacteriota bacterium]|nr:family 43 glycosylhydrolase [Abditibacteriota bacterium]